MSEAPGPPGQPDLGWWWTAPFDPLTEFMSQLRECLCGELARAGRPVCDCAEYAGDEPAPADNCACSCTVIVTGPDGSEREIAGQGQAWVRLEEMPGQSYNRRSARTLGQPGAFDGCATLHPRNVIVELGVYRCISTPANDGTPPSEAQRTADARSYYADLNVLWRVFECCPVLMAEEMHPQADTAGPIGPDGGCFGTRMRFWLELPAEGPPNPDPGPEPEPAMGFAPHPPEIG